MSTGKPHAAYARQVVYTRAVSPDNDNDLTEVPTRALLVAETGAVAVVYPNGMEDTITLAAGILHPIAVNRVKVTGTTATGIKAGY